ncbi:MAG: hypothetical protein A2Y62_01790 [Candidatus Fischerbacteria bacterium RBG_13_37_8]|uniref:Chordopoxvirus fusion protein n=1 Tax=Candidatus Fischerbacteria bacterium RBG_13_37_8 TaxID=1817863 RepID=A0A1F5VE67_9BACT|nr:MAG: hypothetical protein A2Y62_01790 [Candidatus Fischerbacteria bacterium RBG_13_37_8]
MAKYLEIIEELPKDIQAPILKLLQVLREDIANTVTKSDFSDLKAIVVDLGEAQKRTANKIEALVEAQRRTESKVEQLAEAQRRTENKVEQLAEAQRRTESKVEQLAEAQNKTEAALLSLEKIIEQLAEAQRKTEIELSLLSKDHKDVKKMVGGMSNTIGYDLENIAYKSLPFLLKRDFNLEIKGNLIRKNLKYPDNSYDEINIFGSGIIGEQEVYIIGECKSQLGKKHIDKFFKLLQRIENKLGYKNILYFIVTHFADPAIEDYVKAKNIKVYYSYEF